MCTKKNSGRQHGSGVFPGLRCDGAAVDSAGMCVCVFLCARVCVCLGEGYRGLFGGVKKGVRGEKRLTEGTAKTEPSLLGAGQPEPSSC